MNCLLKFLYTTAPILVLPTGCATGVSDDQQQDPDDSGLEPSVVADAHLTSFGSRKVPEVRPYSLETVLGGDLKVTGTYKGDNWYIAFVPGTEPYSEGAQIIASAATLPSDPESIDLSWTSLNYGDSASAGSDPAADDIFTIYLSARSTAKNSEDNTEDLDSIQIRLDNTPPIAHITRMCMDAAGTDCFQFVEGASDILKVSKSKDTTRIYLHGLALDKNFSGYNLRMVGGQADSEVLICGGSLEENIGCVSEGGISAGPFGYGEAFDLYNQPTLSEGKMIDGYSKDALLMEWDISYLTPDAYALHLTASSKAHMNGDDDPYGSSTWVTLLIEP